MKNPCFWSFQMMIICFSLFILAGRTTSQNTKCPFQYVYHFGDGYTDIGNSIKVLSNGSSLPSANPPYGETWPGYPTGRWCDGLTDFDYASVDFGVPNIVPYLSMDASATYDGVIFSVASSPVLDREFFESKGINIEPFAVPLSGQMSWFKTALESICSTPAECAEWLATTLVLFGDIEGNDIGYSLTQGKSIEEVQTYVPTIISTMIDAAKEVVNMGATRVIIPGNAPLGCYPYILTALYTNDSSAYDDIGCLKSVNDFIESKNNYLQQAIVDLQSEFPNVAFYYGDMYTTIARFIREASIIGPEGNNALKACCGIGGNYNYDSQRFCGSSGVPVCSNPSEYVFWDGQHLTQHAYFVVEQIAVVPALLSLNCTLTASM